MFLQRSRTSRCGGGAIRDWLLLLMRLAALALIVAGVRASVLQARRELAAAAQNGAREAVILVDTSYSMDTAIAGSRREAAARDAISGLGPGDRASLVFFSSGAESRSAPPRIAAGSRRRSPPL